MPKLPAVRIKMHGLNTTFSTQSWCEDRFSWVTQAARQSQEWCLWWYITRWWGRILHNKKGGKIVRPLQCGQFCYFNFPPCHPVHLAKKMKGHPRQRTASLPSRFYSCVEFQEGKAWNLHHDIFTLSENVFSESIWHTPLNLRIITFVGDKWNRRRGKIDPSSASSRLSALIALLS